MTDRLRQLRRLQWGVRAALALGIAASIAGNVVHARPELTARLISGWSPVALMISIEILARVPVHRQSLAVLGRLVTGAVAAIAGVISYSHLVAVARTYGETSANAHLLPFSVDGMIVLASIALLEVGGQIRAELGGAVPVALATTAPEVASEVATTTAEPVPVATRPRRRPAARPKRGTGRHEVAKAVSQIPADDDRSQRAVAAEIAARVGLTVPTVRRYLAELPAESGQVTG